MRLQAAQVPGRSWRARGRPRTAGAELIEHGRAAQEPLDGLRLLGQGLAVQVVGHVPVVTGDGLRLAAALLGDQGGEVEADRPASVRSVTTAASSGVRLTCAFEKICRAPPHQGQLAGPEFQRISRGAQPRQVRLLGTARGGQLRPGGIAEITRLSTSWQAGDCSS